MIDYSWVTDETRADYERVLRTDAVKFLSWRARSSHRRALQFEQAFRSWWLVHGRTGFRTVKDGLRFRKELLAFAAGMHYDLAGAQDG